MSTESTYWDRKYGRPGLVYGENPNRFLVEYAPRFITPGARVLSLGEGEGRNAVWLAGVGFSVTAVDFSQPALEKLAALAQSEGVHVNGVHSDVDEYDFGIARWDAIVLLHLHLPSRPRHRLHRRIERALKPGGVLILETLHVDQIGKPSGGPETPELYYTEEVLRHDFERLKRCILVEEERYIEAGEHRGMTNVIGFVGKRGGDV